MNTKRKTPKLTKKQRQRLRVRQVRRQKFFLGLIFLLVLGCIFLRLSRFSGKQTNTYQINASCEAYRDEVTTEAAQYGMSDYVDLILAVMMQESSGQGTDPMQSSEGAYNTQYPQQPNGITDPSYSISCGIQELKYALDKSGCTGPADLPHIRLALQAYNFGTDSYFSYLEKTEKLPGQLKAPRHSPRWQVVADNVMKMILFTIRQGHGITVTSIILITYFAIIIQAADLKHPDLEMSSFF